MEMDNPQQANFAVFEYRMPSGIMCGVGKSKVPNHPSLFQIRIFDYDGKPNAQIDDRFAGEYTSADRAEKELNIYCKQAWANAEAKMEKATRKAHAEKQKRAADKAD